MLVAIDHIPGEPIELGDMVTVVNVSAAHVVKDIRENIRNLMGGRMVHYEELMRNAVNTALKELDEAALAKGYDGVIGVRLSHPSLVEGGIEVVAYGSAFRFVARKEEHEQASSL